MYRFTARLCAVAAFADALEFTRTAKKPVVIELKVDPQDLTPDATLDAITETARKAKGL